ncbi:TetR family transcriptional regulator [Cryptosporangium aurantiacum]|uniref:Transcriptional regulator, TetR family n=1 Tax=Cryptosporangium aurantiacum TaxID=134849 RepID=A0A1M7RNQ4_9ACTN|nr:TetR family transcriptional regulator [Cryptosporangium aurantiacum]SHN47943.1 transcriptional regulator, TetR family [Cryptosporangium aurantiacum]
MTEASKPAGLRERQRQAIRADTRTAALELFEKRGFDDVSVAEIAAEAGISERTFFRHFPTKEDVVLTLLESYGPDILSRLETESLDKPWLEVLGDTYIGMAGVEVTMEGEFATELDRAIVQVFRLAQRSTRLQAGIDARMRVWQDDIAQIVARRLGVDIDADPRPRIWGAVTIAVVTTNSARRAALHGSVIGAPAEGWQALTDLLQPPP